MPTVNLPGTDSPGTTSYTGDSDVIIYSLFTTPLGRAMANGGRQIYITGFGLYVGGRGAARSVRSWFAGNLGTAVSVASETTPTKKTLPVNIHALGGNSFQYGFHSNGPANWRRGGDSGGARTWSSKSSTTWAQALSGTVTYAEAPAAPTMATVGSATKDSLTVVFHGNDNGGSGITGWKLQYSKSSSFADPVTIDSSGTSVVTGLDPDTTYYFRAAGRNYVTDYHGTYGPWSTTGTGTTLSGAPSAPSDVALSQLGPTSSKLDWEAPTQDGGSPVTGYEVEYADNSGFAGATSVNVGLSLTWTSPSLAAGAWYFRVRAVNANGNGTWSAVKSNTVTLRGFPNVRIGSSFDVKPMKRWTGSEWAVVPLKRWNGSAWITLT